MILLPYYCARAVAVPAELPVEPVDPVDPVEPDEKPVFSEVLPVVPVLPVWLPEVPGKSVEVLFCDMLLILL